jgi:hypothetical protein
MLDRLVYQVHLTFWIQVLQESKVVVIMVAQLVLAWLVHLIPNMVEQLLLECLIQEVVFNKLDLTVML